MIDQTSTAEGTLESRFPAAYSHGYAHVRILTVIDPDDPGPLGGSRLLEIPIAPEVALESAPRAPLDDLLRAD